MKPALRAFAAFALVATGQAFGQGQSKVDDVFDTFFRYTETAHREFYEGTPEESIDPFSGTLHIVQTDLVLPGKAGLDLKIVRSYSSKIWSRTDFSDLSLLLAEQDHSVLGYGWTFHMGRILNPNATGAATSPCTTDNPLLQMPDGSSRAFYRSSAHSGFFVSRDYWLMQQNCTAMGGNGKGTCVWSTDGVRYELSPANSYSYGTGTPFGPSTLVWPVSKVVDRHGNSISISYVTNGNGAIDHIVDSYGRVVSFSYANGGDGLRLSTMTANSKTYTYLHTPYATLGGGTMSPRRFLTEARPPAGPSYKYGYAISASIATNQYALNTLTYPQGGSANYVYKSTSFYYGVKGFTVPFAAVFSKTTKDRDGKTLGTWGYSYTSPESGMNVTTIVRPDGKNDVYSMYGFGNSSAGSLWRIGTTQQISRADGAEVETRVWNAGPAVSTSFVSAPAYSQCAGTQLPVDNAVYVPQQAQRSIARGGRTYTAATTSFDSYGQPRIVKETGEQSRETTWTYEYAFTDQGGAPLNFILGMPLTQHVCVGSSDCFDNTWTYNAPAMLATVRRSAG